MLSEWGVVLSVAGWRVELPWIVSGGPYIECVFENDLVELDAAGTLAAAEANERTLTTAEIRRLHLAAHWADLHAGEAVSPSRIKGAEHPVRLGGEGTPTVAEFAPAELGAALGMSDGSASRLIADALDLRHRLPSIWTTAQTGQAPIYQARHIATATRQLTAKQAGFVDQRIAPALGTVSFGRLQTLVDAAIMEADPEGCRTAGRGGRPGTVCAVGPQIRTRPEVDHCPGYRRGCDLVQSRHRPHRRHPGPARRPRHHRGTPLQGDRGYRPTPPKRCGCYMPIKTTSGTALGNQMIVSLPRRTPTTLSSRLIRRMTTTPNRVPALTSTLRLDPLTTSRRRRKPMHQRRRRTARCKSHRRRSTPTGLGRAPSSMSTSASKPSPPAPASAAPKTSGQSC